MTKFEIAYNMYLENPDVARKDFIARLMTEVGMTAAGASTYHHKCKTKLASSTGTVSVTTAVATTPTEEEDAAEDNLVVAASNKGSSEPYDYGDSVPDFIKKSYARLGFDVS